jgi:hypothetical protein
MKNYKHVMEKCLELPLKVGGLLEKQSPIFVLGDIIIILQ